MIPLLGKVGALVILGALTLRLLDKRESRKQDGLHCLWLAFNKKLDELFDGPDTEADDWLELIPVLEEVDEYVAARDGKETSLALRADRLSGGLLQRIKQKRRPVK